MEIESNFYPPNISVKSLSTKEAEVNMSADPSKDTQLSQSGNGQILIKNSIQSQNFIKGVSGWQLKANGDSDINPNPANSRCRVYLNANATITTGGPRKILFDTKTYDNLSEFDTTNNRFVAKSTGNYLVSSVVQADPSAGNLLYVIFLYVNNASVAQSNFYSATGGTFSLNITDIIRLTAEDYVEIFIQGTEGADYTAIGTSLRTFLSIHRLS